MLTILHIVDYQSTHRLHVCLPQVVRSHEPLVAHRADEVLLAGVGADVARQLVRPRELLEAAVPGAGEGSLSCG